MPVLAGAPQGPGPQAFPGLVARSRLTWTDPDGNVWDLTDLTMSDGVICTGVSGLGGMPSALTALPLPTGAIIPIAGIPQPRTVVLGLYSEAPDQLDPGTGPALFRSVTYAFWTNRAGKPVPGYLGVQQPDGTQRLLECYVTSGLDQPDSTEIPLWHSTWALTMLAQPYWIDVPAKQVGPIVFALPTAGAGVPPMPPVLLSAATTLGNAVINNTGDSDAYPVWKVSGPGQPSVTNSTTGRQWAFDTSVPAGDVWTVVTDPVAGTSVTDLAGNSQWAHLAAASPRDLWPLVAGINNLNVTLSGATTGSQVALYYTRRWLRP